MERIFTMKLANGTVYQARGDEGLELGPHDECVIHKDFYTDLARVLQCGELLSEGSGAELPQILRRADDQDRATAEVNEPKNISAFRTAKQIVSAMGLPMKLLNAHYSLDCKMLLIQFTADGRVDFRDLVKELARTMGTRIELRQIGVRDESAIYGGISVCGQVLCCCRFLREFNSINVKMAKDQDLSLTPSTISGVCGRLKCCLKFEHAGYQELEKTMPRRGEWCECDRGRGKVTDRNLLTQQVTLTMEGGGTIRCHVSELKKTTPPEKKPIKPASEKNSRNNGENPNRTNGNSNRQDQKNRQKNNRSSGRKQENKNVGQSAGEHSSADIKS